jgi:hypothetical protein
MRYLAGQSIDAAGWSGGFVVAIADGADVVFREITPTDERVRRVAPGYGYLRDVRAAVSPSGDVAAVCRAEINGRDECLVIRGSQVDRPGLPSVAQQGAAIRWAGQFEVYTQTASDDDGVTYTVLPDDGLRRDVRALRFGGTSQGFLGIATDGTPRWTDDYRSGDRRCTQEAGPVRVWQYGSGDWLGGEVYHGPRFTAAREWCLCPRVAQSGDRWAIVATFARQRVGYLEVPPFPAWSAALTIEPFPSVSRPPTETSFPALAVF